MKDCIEFVPDLKSPHNQEYLQADSEVKLEEYACQIDYLDV